MGFEIMGEYKMDFSQWKWINESSAEITNNTVKVGLGAQAPLGNGGYRVFSNIQLEHKTVKNLRSGE